MGSTGYYKICPKCGRKYGRHFVWCLDCTPRAKLDKDGSFPRDTYKTRYGRILYKDRVLLYFCCSKKLPLDIRMCDKCRAKFKCYTQSDDE